ncbi:unnamed protein product, partial [marine sediment metagenome]
KARVGYKPKTPSEIEKAVEVVKPTSRQEIQRSLYEKMGYKVTMVNGTLRATRAGRTVHISKEGKTVTAPAEAKVRMEFVSSPAEERRKIKVKALVEERKRVAKPPKYIVGEIPRKDVRVIPFEKLAREEKLALLPTPLVAQLREYRGKPAEYAKFKPTGYKYKIKQKKLLPEEYAKYLQLRGKLGEVKYVPEIEGDVLGRTTIVPFAKPSIKIKKADRELGFLGKYEEREALGHELIHAITVPWGVSKIEKWFIPYKYRPSELLAYKFEKKVAKEGFPIPAFSITKEPIFGYPPIIQRRIAIREGLMLPIRTVKAAAVMIGKPLVKPVAERLEKPFAIEEKKWRERVVRLE